jgi:hypothetical protein
MRSRAVINVASIALDRQKPYTRAGTAAYDSDPRRVLDANRLHEEAYQHRAVCACGGVSGLPGGMPERGPASANHHYYNHENDGGIARSRAEQQPSCGSGRPVTGMQRS